MPRSGSPRHALRGVLTRALALLLTAASPGAGQGNPHEAFDRLLRGHVRDGLVDYDAFAADPSFAGYLSLLAATDPSGWPRDEQLAFWINAYNAYTIAQVNAHGERRSIRNINRTLGLVSTGGAWRERMATVGGRTFTLDEIEHDRIRPVFREPRVHFALVCAAKGCPPLRSEAYTGHRLAAQLDDQARRFLRESPARNRVDVATRTVYLSRIFDWYGEDFAPDADGLLRWLARYWPEGPERALLAAGKARVVWTPYDWSLNRR
jgi:hypothetical protein